MAVIPLRVIVDEKSKNWNSCDLKTFVDPNLSAINEKKIKKKIPLPQIKSGESYVCATFTYCTKNTIAA